MHESNIKSDMLMKYRCSMPMEDSLCLIRLSLPSLLLLCWIETLHICTTTSHSSLAVRRLSLGPGSSLQVEARSWPSCEVVKKMRETDKENLFNSIHQSIFMQTESKWMKKQTFYLDVWIVHDQRWWHLQSKVIVLPPVQHEGNTLFSNHLTQRDIWAQRHEKVAQTWKCPFHNSSFSPII